MLKRIETSEVIRRATQAFDDHNSKCPKVTHVRRTARGPIEVSRPVGTIPESVTTTFHTILTAYVVNYNRMREIMPLSVQDPNSPPALQTTNGSIAKYCRCSGRTVQNHISCLRDLGFLQTKFRGSRHAFELWITPKFLFGEAVLETAKNVLETASEELERKNFPHNSTHREIFETETRSADMLISHGEDFQGQRGKTETETPGVDDVHVSRREEKEGGAARREKSKIVAENDRERRENATAMLEARRPKAPAGLNPLFAKMLFDFWLYAWQVVYPKRNFDKDQQEKALSAIANGVYANFEGEWNEQQWLNYHQIQLAKLDKAGRYYDNHPNAYRPDPYAVHIPGKGYFDSANTNGFIGIDAWMKQDSFRHTRNRKAYADKQEAKTRRAEALLRTARRDFEKLRRNDRPRKEVQQLDQLGLFQYYSTVFTGIGKKWQEAFCQQFLEQQQRDFQPPAYYKKRRLRAMADQKTTVVHVEPWMHFDNGFYTD